MEHRKGLHLLGILLASLALVTMIVTASGNLLSSSFAQGEQNFTAKMTDKEEVVSVHSPDANVKGPSQRSEMTYPAVQAGMVENQTVTTIKLNTTQFQTDKSQFKKAPEFAQISGYINTPNNNSPITLSSLGNFKASDPDSSIRVFLPYVRESLNSMDKKLVDVRGPEEYSGKILVPPEYASEQPQRGGHIPGAINIPWNLAE